MPTDSLPQVSVPKCLLWIGEITVVGLLTTSVALCAQQGKQLRDSPAQKKTEYTHKGFLQISLIEAPDTYTAHVEGLEDETCTFYSHDAYCAKTDYSPRPPGESDFALLLDDKSLREVKGFCGDATVRRILGDRVKALFGYIAPFPYRMEGEKLYIPYHVEIGVASRKEYLFVSTADARIDGEACIELVPLPVPPTALPGSVPVLPHPKK